MAFRLCLVFVGVLLMVAGLRGNPGLFSQEGLTVPVQIAAVAAFFLGAILFVWGCLSKRQ